MANEPKPTIPVNAAAEATADATLTDIADAIVSVRRDEGTAALPSLRGMLRQLFAAAPALLRALAAVEWSGHDEWPECPECPECRWSKDVHSRNCPLDAALTAAGLATQEQRDAARRST